MERHPSLEISHASVTTVVELLHCGDMDLSVVIARNGKIYRVDEQLYTDDPVYVSESEYIDPTDDLYDPADPFYLGQRLVGEWTLYDSIQNENAIPLRAGIPIEVDPRTLGCLMDVIPQSRWYRALDERQAQEILDTIMDRLMS